MSKQNKFTKSARNQDCQVRIEGVCNFDSATTVLAHLPGGGWGAKSKDIHAAYCCSSCHSLLDGHAGEVINPCTEKPFTREELDVRHYEGVFRTQKIMIELGLIKL